MRVAVVVAAMLFCAPVFAQGVKLPSVTNLIGMELIEIPAGKFTMGSPEDEKGHRTEEAQVSVTLTKSFWLGKTEVTQGQWDSVMGKVAWVSFGRNFQVQADKDFPATMVSWLQATEFCKKLTKLERESGKLSFEEGYRLPTEAEWEYACRAGTETAFSFGNDESKLGDYAWFSGNAYLAGEKYAHKVGLKKPNPWGLHDMHGNVGEWCSDWWGSEPSGGRNPVGPSAGSTRVIRGGFYSREPGVCRSAGDRESAEPLTWKPVFGVRVARSQSVQ